MDRILQALSRIIWKFTDTRKVLSLLDLGCGFGFHIPFPFAEYKVGLDVHEPSLRSAKERFDDVILADMRILPVRLESVDQISIMETAEHLKKEEGEKLLKRLSNSNVLLTTPLDFHDWASWQRFKGDVRHSHRSCWTPEELEELGFSTRTVRFDLLRQLIFRTRGIIVARSHASSRPDY